MVMGARGVSLQIGERGAVSDNPTKILYGEVLLRKHDVIEAQTNPKRLVGGSADESERRCRRKSQSPAF
jgi:hypothetical protein